MRKDDWEGIDVNPRKTDKVYFESSLIQNISDSIDFLKDETTEILRELDSNEFKQKIDEFDLEEFSEETTYQIGEIFDEISQFKDKVIDHDELPDDVKEFSKNTKAFLNRDEDYIRKAKRKLEKSDSFRTSVRVIELCDKAINLDGENTEPHYLKGLALVRLKNYDDAVEEFINVLALDEDNLDARLAIAGVNRLSGEFEDAIDVYDSVLKVDDESFDAFKGKALTYFDMEDYKKADEFFTKANSSKTLNGNTKKIWDLCLDNL